MSDFGWFCLGLAPGFLVAFRYWVRAVRQGARADILVRSMAYTTHSLTGIIAGVFGQESAMEKVGQVNEMVTHIIAADKEMAAGISAPIIRRKGNA